MKRMTPVRSAQWANIFFQQPPGFGSHLFLDLRIKAGLAEFLPERRDFRPGEFQALGFQRAQQRIVRDHSIGTLFQRGVGKHCFDNVAQILRQFLPGTRVEGDMVTGSLVIGDRAVFLDLIKFRRVDDDQRIFLAIGQTGLRHAVNLAEIDRDRSRAQMLEHRDRHRRDRQAQFHALKVGRRMDRFVPCGDLTEPMIERTLQADHVRFFGLPPHEIAEIAVDRLPDHVIVRKREARADDPGRWLARRRQVALQHIHRHRARHTSREHRGVGAQSGVGINRDGEAAGGFFFQSLRRLDAADGRSAARSRA